MERSLPPTRGRCAAHKYQSRPGRSKHSGLTWASRYSAGHGSRYILEVTQYACVVRINELTMQQHTREGRLVGVLAMAAARGAELVTPSRCPWP